MAAPAPAPGPGRIRWTEGQSAAVNARRELPALVSGYFARVRDLMAKEPSAPRLHRVRLATKRLRYTLELFRSCYGPGLETRLAELREIQQVLGDVNDCEAARRLLSKRMAVSPQKERVEKFLASRLAAKALDFRTHWTGVFDVPGRERWWTSYLAREARTPARRA